MTHGQVPRVAQTMLSLRAVVSRASIVQLIIICIVTGTVSKLGPVLCIEDLSVLFRDVDVQHVVFNPFLVGGGLFDSLGFVHVSADRMTDYDRFR